MIPQVTITGNLPNVNADFAEQMGLIGQLLFDSITQNFIDGGRPDQWEPLKAGGKSHLIQSGALVESLQMTSDQNSAMVSVDTNQIPYAAIHNFGGTIQHPGSNKFQAFEYDGGMVFTWKTKPHKIRIPQRQFMLFQQEDKQKILAMLAGAIFTQSTRRTQ